MNIRYYSTVESILFHHAFRGYEVHTLHYLVHDHRHVSVTTPEGAVFVLLVGTLMLRL